MLSNPKSLNRTDNRLFHSLLNRKVALPHLNRHLPGTEIEGFPSLLLPALVRQPQLIPMQHARQEDGLFQVRNVAPNAASRPRTERDKVRLHFLGALLEPAFGTECLGFREHRGVAVGDIGGDADRGVAGDEGVEDGGAFGGRAAWEAEGGWRKEAHGFVEAGAQVGEVPDFVVGSDDFRREEDRVELRTEEREAAGIFEQKVHRVVHGDGSGICQWKGY